MTLSKEDYFHIQRLLTRGDSVILEINVKNHFGNSLDMTLKPEQEKVSVYFNLDNLFLKPDL
jgi:hypothetical protein